MRQSKLADAATALVLLCCNPVRVILFGSQVDGSLHPGSDLDLLVVCRPGYCKREVEKELRESLRRFAVPIDVHCATTEEVAAAEHCQYSILHTMLTGGVQLYP